VLPDEPYTFGPRGARIHLIDGTMVSWYGPRIRRAIETLRPLLTP
jgi:hypothetical protein